MKLTVKILLLFALINAFIPLQEMYEYTLKDSIEHNCCSDSPEGDDSGSTCKLLCHCFSTITASNVSPASLSLEVKFIHYQSNTNKYIEEQTGSVFRPPIV